MHNSYGHCLIVYVFTKTLYVFEREREIQQLAIGLYPQSSSDITQIRELQAELEEVKKERQILQEQVRLDMVARN